MSALLRRFAPKGDETPKSKSNFAHKPLIVGNKGLSHSTAQILDDFVTLVPHSKKESKIHEDDFFTLDEIATDVHCDTVALLQTLHHEEPYLWLSKVPEGPSMCIFIEEMDSIRALGLIGNCLKGSRPLCFFDSGFASTNVLSMAKELLSRLFTVPYQDPHSKPFVDRAMSFNVVDGKIVIRHYQIQWEDTPVLVEIGHRLTLVPMFILAGAFKGHKIWKNAEYITPYKLRMNEKKEKNLEKRILREHQAEREERKHSIPKIQDKMKGVFKQSKK